MATYHIRTQKREILRNVPIANVELVVSRTVSCHQDIVDIHDTKATATWLYDSSVGGLSRCNEECKSNFRTSVLLSTKKTLIKTDPSAPLYIESQFEGVQVNWDENPCSSRNGSEYTIAPDSLPPVVSCRLPLMISAVPKKSRLSGVKGNSKNSFGSNDAKVHSVMSWRNLAWPVPPLKPV